VQPQRPSQEAAAASAAGHDAASGRSRHVWIEGRPAMDLIVTLDDPTSAIYSMILVEEEGTASTFQASSEVIVAHAV
jgi:hypothetical protein